ncbi:MAG: hypothetical protein JXA14_00860 [Anaerolineae bacterium]|nr:hypothetical protein [Anaerolineae bacterium]
MQSSIELLRTAGMANPLRVVRLMRQFVDAWSLDLSGLTVLTEAASGYYAVTPVLAALAGASRVVALTRDSQYGTAEEAIGQTRAVETLCGLPELVEIHNCRDLGLFKDVDIVTNLGFVRPIDADVVDVMKLTAVVPLMCETWEVRPGDVDLDACRARGILVMGTNESAAGLDVFESCGALCLQMLFEAGLEVHQNRIVIVSSDRFGQVLLAALHATGADAVQVGPAVLAEQPEVVAECDAVVLADYTYPYALVGKDAPLTGSQLAALAPGTTVIQFAGGGDVHDLERHGIHSIPQHSVSPFRMGRTLAALGPKPVVDLHGAGLKVGERMARIRQATPDVAQANAAVLRECVLAQSVLPEPGSLTGGLG